VVQNNKSFVMSDESSQQLITAKQPSFADLFPELTSDDQQRDADYRLRGYLSVVKRIFDRVCDEKSDILTELQRRARLRRRGGYR